MHRGILFVKSDNWSPEEGDVIVNILNLSIQGSYARSDLICKED